MEHSLIREWFADNNFDIRGDRILKLSLYSKLIFEENKKYNLTGLKTLDEMVNYLILKSLDPLKFFSVLRGTSFVDIGTGSGVPGVVLAIFFPKLKGLLIDANKKKINFINKVIKELAMDNLITKNDRIEELAHDESYREKYDFCVSRAFGPLYYSIEFGLPMIKEHGFLYIYSNLQRDLLSRQILAHVENLDGKILNNKKHPGYGLSEEGLLIFKKNKNKKLFPRKFSQIKREALKIKEIVDS